MSLAYAGGFSDEWLLSFVGGRVLIHAAHEKLKVESAVEPGSRTLDTASEPKKHYDSSYRRLWVNHT